MNQVAVSSFFNRILRELYLWALYLSEGIFSGTHVFTGGDVTVEDDLEVDNDLTVGGIITADAGVSTFLGVAVGAGGATIDGDALVTGDHVVVGRIYEDTARWRKVPVAAGIGLATGGDAVSGAFSADGGAWLPDNTSDKFLIPIVLNEGEDLIQVVGIVETGTTNGITMSVFRNDGTGLTGLEGSANADNSGEQLLTVPITQAVEGVDNATYLARFTFTATASTALYGIRFQVTRPAP